MVVLGAGSVEVGMGVRLVLAVVAVGREMTAELLPLLVVLVLVAVGGWRRAAQ